MSFTTAGLATATAFCAGLFPLGAGLAAFVPFTRRLFDGLPDGDERRRSEIVSTRFSVARWATALNLVV